MVEERCTATEAAFERAFAAVLRRDAPEFAALAAFDRGECPRSGAEQAPRDRRGT